MKRILTVDISNVLYRTFFANKNEDDATIAGLAQHRALTTLNKYYKQFQPTHLILAFDRPNWRKTYTKSEACLTWKPYKGHRRKDMTPAQKEKYKLFLEHLDDFESMMREHTAVVCLAADGLEADDLMAGIAQRFGDTDEVILVSADKDLIQLLRHPNITLLSPDTGKNRTLDEWNGDADYFIFEKCFRGDAGDNVQSAYPRLRSTKIQKAYNDPYFCVNLMNEKWINENGDEVLVKDMFEENKLLMDLTEQPPSIRQKIDETINDGLANPGSYSHFHFLKFCGKYELKRISEQAELFVRMLS